MVAAMPEIKAVVGRSVTVICPASGYPLDTISWARGNSARPLFLARITPPPVLGPITSPLVRQDAPRPRWQGAGLPKRLPGPAHRHQRGRWQVGGGIELDLITENIARLCPSDG